MAYVLMIAGLPGEAFDRVAKISSNRLAPGGTLVMKPLPAAAGYPDSHHGAYLVEANKILLRFGETEPVQSLLLYVNHKDGSTAPFVDRFFPFSLPLAVEMPDLSSARNANERNKLLNDFADELVKRATHLRAVARVVSEQTSVANLTPLLLPLRNFGSRHLEDMFREIFERVACEPDPKTFLKARVEEFLRKHPRTFAEGAKRNCLSDGVLYFQSPGKALHGFTRHTSREGHDEECLLNARSRLGGDYRHSFHYDCLPVRGKLRAHYDNCHGSPTAPKKTHVNIAPNDYII